MQRASGATVTVTGNPVGGFDGLGLVALIGVTHDDSNESAKRLASKLYGLRIFDAQTLAAHGVTTDSTSELSASDISAPVLVISQFTLYANTKKGRRPTWDAAAPGDIAEPLVDEVVRELRALGAQVSTGKFGTDMQLTLTNTGPMTVLLEV